MPRLIDADALLERFDAEFFKTDPTGEEQLGFLNCRRIAREMPTIDAEPVRHGRWIEYTHWIGAFGQIYSKCSECGTTYSGRKGSRGDGKGGKFCEECGAKMDEGELIQ